MASDTNGNEAVNKQVIDAIIRFQAGDADAFTDFYLGTEKMVFKFCYDMLHNKEGGEDVSQLVYTRAYRKLDLLKDPKAYGQWLKVISHNLCRNFIDKESKNKTTDIDEYQNYEENGWDVFDDLPDYFIEDEQKREIIDKILKESLSDVQFQTLWLRYFADKSEQEIAGIMGCSLGTVKSRTNSAKTKFRESLEKYVDKNKIVLGTTPFLTRYLKHQGTGKAMKAAPAVPLAANAAKTAGAAKAAGAATVKAGFLSTAIGKAAVSTFAVLLTGGIAAAVLLNLPPKAKEPEETEETIETTESEEITKPAAVPTQTKPVPATTETTVKREATVYEAKTISGVNAMGPVEYVVPGIDITGLDMTEVNNEIQEYVDSVLEPQYGQNYFMYTGGYSCYISDDIVSLIFVYDYEDGGSDIRVFNIEVQSGKLLDRDEFLDLIGMSNDEFESLALDTLNSAMDENPGWFESDYNKWPLDDDFSTDSSTWVTLRVYNTRQEALDNCIPYYSDRGNLCFVDMFNTYGDAGNYLTCFDTQTHEHYTESYYGWCTYG